MIDLLPIEKLSLSLILSALIGYERELQRRGAGLRTHILVGLGACLAAIVDVHLHSIYSGADVSRISAQVVSGIGFLGAGTIMRNRASVKGLTTAASLWGVAIVGLTVGHGLMMPAISCVLLILGTLIVLSKMKNKWRSRHGR
jgi:putative Mg2+ transporter-C (MgtC) family protein